MGTLKQILISLSLSVVKKHWYMYEECSTRAASLSQDCSLLVYMLGALSQEPSRETLVSLQVWGQE